MGWSKRHFAFCALVACGGSQFIKPVADPDLPDWAPPATLGEGPLSPTVAVPETPWPERQRLRRIRDEHYVGKDALIEDAQVFLRVVDAFFVPRTPQLKTGLEVARRADTLWRLAPYSLDGVANAYQSYGERLGICVRAPHVMFHCDRDVAPAPPAAAAFELSEAEPGIALLAIHDLSPTANWRAFARALETLARAKAIVIDLRTAAGDDPRHVLPLLERLTGRTSLKPLAAITRPPEADRYVATYNTWFASASRDRGVWQDLVGTMPTRMSTPATPPITIVVGKHCGPACELTARVLATYAGATIIGNVRSSGRIARDEPAMLRLPRSKVDLFFYATEYTLAPEIERATGPTGEWHLVDGDRDHLPFAIREARARIAGGFARCDAFPAYAEPAAMPPALREKLHGNVRPARDCAKIAVVYTDGDVPASALERLLATCGGAIQPRTSGIVPGTISINADLPFATYSQLAQSELVRAVKLDCEPLPNPL